MRARLALSDAARGHVTAYSLPDLDVELRVPMPFRPGRLAASGDLYCADATGPAIYRLNAATLSPEAVFSAAPEIEELLALEDRLYALSGGADSLQMLADDGRLLGLARVGVRPRGMAADGASRQIAVAGGASGTVLRLDARTLRVLSETPAGGAACAVRFLAGGLLALSAAGEYELSTVVGGFGVSLPGMPGALAVCGGGVLVGHLGHLTMLEPPNGRIRWQTRLRGLPAFLAPLGRVAAYADSLEGEIGLIELRKGSILRRNKSCEPSGLALFYGASVGGSFSPSERIMWA